MGSSFKNGLPLKALDGTTQMTTKPIKQLPPKPRSCSNPITVKTFHRSWEQHFFDLPNRPTTPEEELYIRKQIWWTFNDRVRKGKAPFRQACRNKNRELFQLTTGIIEW